MKKLLLIILVVIWINNQTPESLAASLTLSPSSQSIKVGEPLTVTIKFDTSGEVAKVVKASLTFPSSLLTVETDGIQTTGTAITSWTERIYSNSAGTIDLTGNPNASGADKLLASIKFTTKALGTANLSFTTDSQILKASDSSNIIDLQTSKGGAYIIATSVIPPATNEASPPAQIPNQVGFTAPTIALGILAFSFLILGIILSKNWDQNS